MWRLLGPENDLSLRSLPSYRIEFGSQPDDFRCKGNGRFGELPQHLTNILINRDYPRSAHCQSSDTPDIPGQ
jgi:hypothetical protein